jgi:hypothetical protein
MAKQVINVTYEPTGKRGSPEVEGYKFTVHKPETDMQMIEWAELLHSTMTEIASLETITDGETGRVMTNGQVLRWLKRELDAVFHGKRRG